MSTISCPLCSQPNFPNIDSLRISLVSVTNRPLLCPICNEIQMGLDKLTIHLLSHTIKITNESCVRKCSPELSEKIESKLNKFLIVNNDRINNDSSRPMTCTADKQNDNKEFCSASIFGNMYATKRNVFKLDCHICGCTFRTHELQQMHMQLVHEIFSNDTTNSMDIKSIGTADSMSRKTTPFQCDLCSKQFKMKGSLRLHSRMVHGHPSCARKTDSTSDFTESSTPTTGFAENNHQTTSIEFNFAQQATNSIAEKSNLENLKVNGTISKTEVDDGSSNDAPASGEDRLFECDVCTKCFTTKYFLKKHKRLHTGEMPYTCEICNRTFTFQQSYHRHMSYHTDDRPHICSVCGRAFKELSTLHNHERIHSGEKPFKCETCDKCFRQRVSYLVHRRIHTGAMPYECTTCDQKFRYKISLRTHKCTGFVNNNDMPSPVTPSLIENNIDTPDISLNLGSSQALDEFVTESYNRMGIVDHNDQTNGFFHTIHNNAMENQIQNNNSQFAMNEDFHMPSLTFHLEDNKFSYSHDDIPVQASTPNRLPSMSEIFPQALDVLFENDVDNDLERIMLDG